MSAPRVVGWLTTRLARLARRDNRPVPSTADDSLLARRGTLGAVLLVAVIAAIISFVHLEHLARTHGQTDIAAILLPISIDGTVAASSLVMVRAARIGITTPWLARTMLVLSVLATLGGNVAYGITFGAVGAMLSGWPALAFVGCAEMAIGMVRRVRRNGPAAAVTDMVSLPIPTDAESAAAIALMATTAAGNPLSGNRLMERFGLTREQLSKVRQALAVQSNGKGDHHASDAPAA